MEDEVNNQFLISADNNPYLSDLQGQMDDINSQITEIKKKESIWDMPGMIPITKFIPGGNYRNVELKQQRNSLENQLKQLQTQYDSIFNNEMQRKYLKQGIDDKKQILTDMGVDPRYLVQMGNMFNSDFIKTGEFDISGLDGEVKKDDRFIKLVIGLLGFLAKTALGVPPTPKP